MHRLWPHLALERLEELLLIRTGELYLGLAVVNLGHFVLDEEIVYAEFLAFGEGVDAGQDASVFIEVSSLKLADLTIDHAAQDFLDLLPEFLCLAFPALWSIESTHSEDESGRCSIQIENGFYSISISDFANLSEEGLIIERKLRRILSLHKPIVLIRCKWLKLRKCDSFRQE